MPEILRPIYIEKEEGVGSILSRIHKTSESKLALVFPPGSAVFRNVLEVEFLKRELDKLKKDVAIITSDRAQAELAKGMGFKTSDDIKQGKATEEFLEDFYKEKKEEPSKLTTPLVKPKLSDIVSRETEPEKVAKVEIKLPKEEPEIKQKAIEKEPLPQKGEKQEDLTMSPQVEPISLTDEEIKYESGEKKKKKKKLKLRLPKLFFGWLNKLSLTKATKSPLKKIFILLLLLAVGVFVLTATFIFPRADILVRPTKEKAQLNIDLVFDTNVKTVDFEENTVPAQIFKITKTASQEFPATKEEDIRKKAEGTITIYNAYSSESQTLVKTTRFKSPEGKIFRITDTITVPGAKIEGGTIVPSSVNAHVVADQPGEDYNIGPTKFTIPGFQGTDKYEGFYGRSKSNMTGGLIKKGLVVGESDVALAEKALKDQLLKTAKEELKQELGNELKLIEESLSAEIIESTPSPALGEPADKFTLTLKALAQAFAYKEQDLSDLIEEKIALKISDKRLSLPKSQKLNFQYENVDFNTNQASFNLIVNEDISWKIDEQRLKEILAGKNKTEAREAIKLFSEIESVRVSLWPSWLTHIPRDLRKIRTTIDY